MIDERVQKNLKECRAKDMPNGQSFCITPQTAGFQADFAVGKGSKNSLDDRSRSAGRRPVAWLIESESLGSPNSISHRANFVAGLEDSQSILVS